VSIIARTNGGPAARAACSTGWADHRRADDGDEAAGPGRRFVKRPAHALQLRIAAEQRRPTRRHRAGLAALRHAVGAVAEEILVELLGLSLRLDPQLR
jgi:hypothetical protein